MQETLVWSLGWEGFQEEQMATHSIILAWQIPWKGEPGSHSPQRHKESDTTELAWRHACNSMLGNVRSTENSIIGDLGN